MVVNTLTESKRIGTYISTTESTNRVQVTLKIALVTPPNCVPKFFNVQKECSEKTEPMKWS